MFCAEAVTSALKGVPCSTASLPLELRLGLTMCPGVHETFPGLGAELSSPEALDMVPSGGIPAKRVRTDLPFQPVLSIVGL